MGSFGDVRDLGPKGQAIHATAEKLLKDGDITADQHKTLTDGKVDPKDMAIANGVTNKLIGDLTSANMQKLRDVMPLGRQILDLQAQALNSSLAELEQLKARRPELKAGAAAITAETR